MPLDAVGQTAVAVQGRDAAQMGPQAAKMPALLVVERSTEDDQDQDGTQLLSKPVEVMEDDRLSWHLVLANQVSLRLCLSQAWTLTA